MSLKNDATSLCRGTFELVQRFLNYSSAIRFTCGNGLKHLNRNVLKKLHAGLIKSTWGSDLNPAVMRRYRWMLQTIYLFAIYLFVSEAVWTSLTFLSW